MLTREMHLQSTCWNTPGVNYLDKRHLVGICVQVQIGSSAFKIRRDSSCTLKESDSTRCKITSNRCSCMEGV